MSLEETGILKLAGPQLELSRDIAKLIYKHKDEIDQLAAEQGQLHQDDRYYEYEWARLCAMLMESHLKSLP